MYDEQKLRAFGGLIVRMQQGGSLTREESRAAFLQIWHNEQPEVQQGVFIEALRAKGETLEELVGLAESHSIEWRELCPGAVNAPEPHVGIVGVGMDTLKTVNVSSGAAIIAAACGAYVLKIGAPGMTGVSGSADVFCMLGVDGDVPTDRVLMAVRECRIGFESFVGAGVRHTGTFRVLSQLRCATPLHRAGPLGFHSEDEVYKIVGVPHPSQTRRTIEMMKMLGYRRALSPCGGSYEHADRYMDEFSTVGPTSVAELKDDGSIVEYQVTPEEAGCPRDSYAAVAQEPSREANVRKLARVLVRRDQQPAVVNLLALNAASILKLAGKVESLADGVVQAREALQSGRVERQLEALIRVQNRNPAEGLERLRALVAD